MVLDIHAHLYHPRWYPPRFNDYLKQDFDRRQSRRDGNTQSAPRGDFIKRLLSDKTGTAALRIMDQIGIEKRVLLIVDWGIELGEAEVSIETVHSEILNICRHSNGRFLGFAGLDPRRPDAIEILRRAVDDLGAVGLKLHPTGAWTLADTQALDLVAFAVSRRLPVLVHIGRSLEILSDRNAQPEDLVKLASRFPEGVFIAGHSGFELFHVFLAMPDIPANIYFDISGWQALVNGNQTLLANYLTPMLETYPKRVYFGTDSPFFSYNLVTQEKQWLGLIRDYVASASETLRPAAGEILNGPTPLRAAILGTSNLEIQIIPPV